MELWNVNNERFQKEGNKIIKQEGELLILLRYSGGAGSKDFIIINSEEEFNQFLKKRTARTSITIFKKFETLTKGLVTDDFIRASLLNLKESKNFDWIVMFPEIKDKWGNIDWSFEENKAELEEILRLQIGDYVRILKEPDWLDEEAIFHAYVPDEDGEVIPGAY